ncbi:MAG: hypothetical protein AAF901_14195, partial [Bacteroidota bacterium]
RKDRLSSIRKQIKRLDLGDKAQWFPGLKFKEPGEFPKASVRGCVMSNYEILAQAAKDKVKHLLMLQEDCVFSRRLIHSETKILEQLNSLDWDFVYFGYQLYLDNQKVSSPKESEHFFPLVDPTQNIRQTHFWACHQRVTQRLVTFMENTFDRPRNHPDCGPMYFDGYMNEFRRRNPDVKTLIAKPMLGWQLYSASNLNPSKLDKSLLLTLPLGPIRAMRNVFRGFTS